MLWLRATLLLATLALHVTTPGDARCLTSVKEVTPKRFLNVEGQTLDIRLEVSRRIGHRLTTAVFAVFLDEVLGYAGVNVVPHDDLFNTSQVLDRLSGPEGDNQSSVPTSMVSLEVWVPTDTNLVSWLDIKHVRECGLLTTSGRWGWFVPAAQSHLGLDHWRDLTSQQSAAAFDLTDVDAAAVADAARDTATGRFYCEEAYCAKGYYTPERCQPRGGKAQPCAVLFAAYPDVTGFVVDHIRELELYVRVVWVGPHLQEITDRLAKGYIRDKSSRSVLLLSWTPSAAVRLDGKTEWRPITFPPCHSEGSVRSAGCQYESQRLVKLAWAKLEKGANPAYEAVHKVYFSERGYADLLELHERRRADEADADLACSWLKDNERTWRRWIPRTEEKNELFIFGIFPISGTAYTAKGIVKAATMAVAAVNRNDSILRDYNLKLFVNNGMCKADVVMKTFIDYILNRKYSKLVGVLGPACSDTVEPLAGVTKHFKTVVISYSAEGSSFSDRSKYPYFFRTIGENKQYKDVYLKLFKKMGWKRVAALTEDGQKYTEYLSHMQDEMQKEGISFIINRKFPRDREKVAMSQYLEDLKSKNARIIIGDVYDTAARAVMCEAYHQHMTARQGYVWFLPLWLSPDWYNTDRYNREYNETVHCNTTQMRDAIDGHLALAHSYFAADSATMQEGRTVGEWRKAYRDNCAAGDYPVPESNYAGYAYDAVWTFAAALDALNKENQSYLSDIHSTVATERYVDALGRTDFQGVSGNVRFLGGGPSRVSTINVVQWIQNTTHLVGSFVPNVNYTTATLDGGVLTLNKSLFTWLTPDRSTPEDGTAPPSHCVFQFLAEAVNVDCEAAMILANVVGICFLIGMVSIAFLIVKRRYDKKARELMRELGMDIQQNTTTLDRWEVPRDTVVINRKLGEGAFGTVYGGETQFADRGWVAVAVKTLKVGSKTDEKLDFLSEADMMKRFDHKNIVKLMGVCTKNEPVYTIMEFMLYGDLKVFLLGRRHLVNSASEESDEVSPKKLTAMALDIARALSYLAELKYVHRDVASRNCLVNANRVVKLGDFGMARSMCDNDYYRFSRKGMLPVRWMAPESLGLGIFTHGSDMWSYGVLLYEIITFGSFPFQGLSNNQVLEHVKQGNTLEIPPQLKPQLASLIKSCWRLDHQKRPKASQLVEELANNPRLIYPCLDMPLASVQMEDTGQMEIHLPEKLRKCSVPPLNGGTKMRERSFSDASDATAAFPAHELTRTDSGTGSVGLDNAGAGPREPLLGASASSLSTASTLARFLRDRCDDGYCQHDPAQTDAVSAV